MRQRIISSVGVVLVGISTIVLGGPFFVALMIAIGIGAASELHQLLRTATEVRLNLPFAAVSIAAIGVFAWLAVPPSIIVAASFSVVAAPLVLALRNPASPTALTGAAFTAVATLYLALPVTAAVSLRQMPGTAADWVAQLNAVGARFGHSTSAGLAWVLMVVVVIWIADSAAYLGGRSFGRRRLAPQISPNKTVEGAIFGVGGALLAALLINGGTGLGLVPLLAAGLGALIGVVGILGDLVESMIKRQLGAKDSGALIPGHGGIFDRVDALLMALPVAWLMAILVTEVGR